MKTNWVSINDDNFIIAIHENWTTGRENPPATGLRVVNFQSDGPRVGVEVVACGHEGCDYFFESGAESRAHDDTWLNIHYQEHRDACEDGEEPCEFCGTWPQKN